MQARRIVIILATLLLVTQFPTTPTFAVGPVTKLPWLGTYSCLGGYHTGYGIDFQLDHKQLYASGSGTIYSIYTSAPDYNTGYTHNNGWGNEVIIQHSDGYYTRYAHLSSVSVSTGQTISLGSPIGISGNSGNTTGAHLHFEVYRYGLSASNSVQPGLISGYNNPITCPGPYSNNDFGLPINIWHAEYFDRAQNWDNPSCKIEDFSGPAIDKNWNNGGPCSRTDDFSARFTGTFNFPSGNYVFRITHDDGAKLFFDGQNIWDNGSSTDNYYIVCSLVNQTISGNHTLELKYWENSGNARIYLDWSTNTSLCQTPDTVTIFEDSGYGGATQYGWHDEGWFHPPDSYPDYVKASSIRIADGWSARIFDDPQGDPSKGQTCFASSDSDLSDNTFNTGVTVNNNGSSIYIYHKEDCPPPPGDANADGKVDGIDYVIWLNHYNQDTANGSRDGDYNSDGKVDGIDYVIWLNNYNKW